MIDELRKSTEQKMQKGLDALRAALGKVRTGRAHTGLLDTVNVDYYGNPAQLSQVGNVTLLDARTLLVTPWEKKMVPAIEKAIREANLGLNPAAMGDAVKVPMPPLTEERRRELIKLVRTEAEAARIAVRNVRRDANTALKDALKKRGISEDQERRAQEEIQKLTDRFVSDVDKALVHKEAELLHV